MSVQNTTIAGQLAAGIDKYRALGKSEQWLASYRRGWAAAGKTSNIHQEIGNESIHR